MCYNLRYLTKKQRDYAIKFGDTPDQIDRLEKQIELFIQKVGNVYHTTAFDHWPLPVMTGDSDLRLCNWGLIPDFIQNSSMYEQKYSNRYLNARIESLFDDEHISPSNQKPFKNPFFDSALERRCVVIADGYYDWHWKGKNSYNFHIELKSGEPMLIAAIWKKWISKEESLERDTVCLVTTRANSLCKQIHNKPKASEGPRQLAILTNEMAQKWLEEGEDIQVLKKIIDIFPEEEMNGYPVKRLFIQEGRRRIPLNTPDCIQRVEIDGYINGLSKKGMDEDPQLGLF